MKERFEQLTVGSRELWERAEGSLPGGNTRTTIFHDPYPVYLLRGEGCRVTDVDGVERIDFINNYTSLIHGHCHPRVVEAVRRQAGELMSAAAPSELEVELAEQLRARVPSIERLRFANSGTEATMLTLRAARAFTGRSKIATFARAYHGSHDYAASIPADPTDPPGGPGDPVGGRRDDRRRALQRPRGDTCRARAPPRRACGGHRRARARRRRRRPGDARVPRFPT